ncbi:MAG: YggT family protein [Syntrophomonadaceae bacterium]|nr:YggT family protein [Syntrophomonadaceae bacterium]
MGLVYILNIALEVYKWLIFVRIFISWVRTDPRQPIVKFLYDVTEPVLAPARKLIPSIGGIDFSPILVFALISILQRTIS